MVIHTCSRFWLDGNISRKVRVSGEVATVGFGRVVEVVGRVVEVVGRVVPVVGLGLVLTTTGRSEGAGAHLSWDIPSP